MYENPVLFPQISNRESWNQIVQIADDDTGDLIALTRKVWRVREVRRVPVADWDEADREYYRLRHRNGVSEEDWLGYFDR